jgi:hypothetical protein
MRCPDVDATEVFRGLTVTVRVRNLWRVRLGVLFLTIAARCLRCRVEVNDVEVADRG